MRRPGRFTSGKDPVHVVQEAGWATGPVWTGAENFAITGIRSPDRPARSESLYRLSHPGPPQFENGTSEWDKSVSFHILSNSNSPVVPFSVVRLCY